MRDEKRVRPSDTVKNHTKRVEMLQEIDEYLKENGPSVCVDIIMSVDIIHSTLLKYIRDGLLLARFVPSGKANGKEKLVCAVNWGKVNSVELPDLLAGRGKWLKKIEALVSQNSMPFRNLSRKTGLPVTTLRHWKNKGWLKGELVDKRIMITGVNYNA